MLNLFKILYHINAKLMECVWTTNFGFYDAYYLVGQNIDVYLFNTNIYLK